MSQRLERVNELMKRELGAVFERDCRQPGSVLTVHEVAVAPDLRTANVWVGVLGREQHASEAIEKLNRQRGHIQRELYRRVKLKRSPQLLFKLDRSVQRAVGIIHALDHLPPPAPEPPPGDLADAGQAPQA